MGLGSAATSSFCKRMHIGTIQHKPMNRTKLGDSPIIQRTSNSVTRLLGDKLALCAQYKHGLNGPRNTGQPKGTQDGLCKQSSVPCLGTYSKEPIRTCLIGVRDVMSKCISALSQQKLALIPSDATHKNKRNKRFLKPQSSVTFERLRFRPNLMRPQIHLPERTGKTR